MITKRRKSRRKVASRKRTTRKKTTAKKRPTRRKTANKRKATRKKKATRKRKAAPKKRKKATKRKAAPKKRKKATKRKAAPKKRKKAAKRKTRRGSNGLTKIKYSVSSDLAAIVGSGQQTRPQIVKKLWVYIKRHNLQDAKNRRLINPDAKLSKVIGSRPVDMLKLAGHLSKHIGK